MKKFISAVFLALFLTPVFGQNHSDRFKRIDVRHYVFEIHVNDSTNRIEGKTNVLIRFLRPGKTVGLDLVNKDFGTGLGMEVQSVESFQKILYYQHDNDKLNITFADSIRQNETVNLQISYSGIPADGLIIAENRFGDRTFFADNWPDRAHNWLPCVDHPSDKATLEFRVYAPDKYQVIGNGFQAEASSLENQMKLTRWKEMVPIPTKLMVIGVARFAVLDNEKVNGVPVSTWVFPQNRKEGFNDYAAGTEPLKYFSEIIGPFSYEKLAHVQSKTRYGGMENAGCIFYAESSVTGQNKAERLIAHETAHQWFGDAVTEQNWHHVWLSEGFATYLTHLYIRHKYGEAAFRKGLQSDRDRVIRFSERNLSPVIDTTILNYNRLLNTNTYQKASWFLHMLHEELGDSIFCTGLKLYYLIYRDSTALTSDFKRVMETGSSRRLDNFFHEWLFQPGHPKIKIDWSQEEHFVSMQIKQVQEEFLFHFPLEIQFETKGGESFIRRFEIDEREKSFSFKCGKEILSVKPDPGVKLLFEEVP